jgi:hypothetical protein
MKTFLSSALLLASLTTMAQTGELINYEYSGKKEKITLQLPKGAEVKPDGKFVINGKSFHIEEVDATPYIEKSKIQSIALNKKQGKELTALSQLYPERTKIGDKTKQVDEFTENQTRISDDNENMSCWYAYKNTDKTMTYNLEGGKVMGNTILLVVMDDKIKAKSIELKNQRELIFEILDSAVLTSVKKAK